MSSFITFFKELFGSLMPNFDIYNYKLEEKIKMKKAKLHIVDNNILSRIQKFYLFMLTVYLDLCNCSCNFLSLELDISGSQFSF